MASRAQPISAGQRAGAAIAALVLLAVLGPLGAVLWRANALSGLGPADLSAIRFTIWQAFLSAAFSVALAVPVARALARRSFPGRGALIALMGAPFILPVIVAILGLITIFGRRGILNEGLVALGLPGLEIYGLHGVVLAHVFFNLPLAVRLFLQGWLAIPAERFRLAATLGFTPRDIARHMEWPMLRQVAPGAFLVIFLICTTSFAVALILGGAVWEELLFRFVLFAAVLAVVHSLLKPFFDDGDDVPRLPGEVLAILVTSLAFAAAHLDSVVGWLGTGGEAYDFSLFAWRAFAGAALAANILAVAIFREAPRRKRGVQTQAHACRMFRHFRNILVNQHLSVTFPHN